MCECKDTSDWRDWRTCGICNKRYNAKLVGNYFYCSNVCSDIRYNQVHKEPETSRYYSWEE